MHEHFTFYVSFEKPEAKACLQCNRSSTPYEQSVYRYLSEYEVESKTQHDFRVEAKAKLNALQVKELHGPEFLAKLIYR